MPVCSIADSANPYAQLIYDRKISFEFAVCIYTAIDNNFRHTTKSILLEQYLKEKSLSNIPLYTEIEIDEVQQKLLDMALIDVATTGNDGASKMAAAIFQRAFRDHYMEELNEIIDHAKWLAHYE